MSNAENIDKTSKQITEEDGRNFDIGYMNRNVVLDPEHQQTRFYNLQAESTLSSLDSNLDPYIPKDLYLPPDVTVFLFEGFPSGSSRGK